MKRFKKVLTVFLSLLLAIGNIPVFAETEYIKSPISFDGDFISGSTDAIFTARHGHAEQITLENDVHGSVINIGIASDDNLPGGATPQVDFKTGKGYTHLTFEFKLCVKEKPTGKGLTLSIRDALNNPDFFIIEGGSFKSGSGTFTYAEGTWYTISVEVNMGTNGYYTVKVIDGETVTNLSTEVAQNFGTFSNWRFWGYWSKSDFCEFYLDDFALFNMIEKPQGYIAPDVSVEADKNEYYLGETVNLTVSPEGTSLENTIVYINDEKVGTYADSSIAVPYTPSEAGTYKVKAVTKNTYGIEVSKELSFKVNPNEAPVVSFVGIDSSVAFEESDDMTLNVAAEDDNGISKIELYVGGELKETALASTLSYDFSQLELDYGTYEIEAKAYDLCNLATSKKISVTLKPDGYISPTVTVSAERYSAVCGETVELTVSAEGSHFNKVDVYINEAFYQSYNEKEFVLPISKDIDGEYTVRVTVWDTIGKDASESVTVAFNLPDGYSSPTVALSATQTNHKLGETATVTVTAGGTHWSLVEIYIDGELYNTYEQSKFNVSFTPEETGTYNIKAIVKDTFDKTSEDCIDFYFNANELPAVSFENFSDGSIINYNYTDSKKLKVIAEDSDGIEKIELYVNGVLVKTQTSDTIQIDFDELDMGLGKFSVKAVAYDAFGLADEASVTVNVTNETRNLSYENSEFESDISFTVNRGHAYVDTYDEEHGQSIFIGMAESDGDPKNDTSQVAIYKGNYTHTNFVFDICVEEAPTGTGMTLTMRNLLDGATQLPDLFKVNGTKFVSSSGQFSYETGKWYSISVETNLQAGWYSVKVIDGETVTPISNSVPYNFGAFSAWRFFTSTSKTDYCEIVLDNFKFYEVLSAPKVVSVGYDDINSADKISVSAQKINLILDSALMKEDINSDKVKLYKGASEINVGQIRYAYAENRIEIVPAEGLLADSDYTIVLDGSIRISDNKTLGAKIKASFITETVGADIQDVAWKLKKDNSAELTYSAENLTYDATSDDCDSVPLKCIVTLWDETGRFVRTYTKEDVLSSQSGDYTFTIPDGALYRAEVYFADSLTAPVIYHTEGFEKDFFPTAPTL